MMKQIVPRIVTSVNPFLAEFLASSGLSNDSLLVHLRRSMVCWYKEWNCVSIKLRFSAGIDPINVLMFFRYSLKPDFNFGSKFIFTRFGNVVFRAESISQI